MAYRFKVNGYPIRIASLETNDGTSILARKDLCKHIAESKEILAMVGRNVTEEEVLGALGQIAYDDFVSTDMPYPNVYSLARQVGWYLRGKHW